MGKFAKEIQEKNTIMRNMKKDIDDKDARIKELNIRIEELLRKLKDSENGSGELNITINKLKIEITQLLEIRNKYEITIKTLTADKDNLEKRLREAENEIARLNKLLNEKEATLKQSHNKNSELSTEIIKLTELLGDHKRQFDLQIKEIGSLKESLNKVTTRYNKLKQKTEKICMTANITDDLEEAKGWNVVIADMQKKMESRISELTQKVDRQIWFALLLLVNKKAKTSEYVNEIILF